MPLTTTIPVIVLALISTYGISLSYKAVTRLRTYESQSEKAAEWSNTAAQRLHKTRTTQAGAAISVRINSADAAWDGPGLMTNNATQIGISTLTSLAVIFGVQGTFTVPLALLNAALLSVSRVHMHNFWNKGNQTQVPFVEKFNLAIKGSEELIVVLQWLALGWGGSAALWWFVG